MAGGRRGITRGGILSRLALRSMARNHTRTLVSVVGIILATALMTAVVTTVTSLDRGLYQHTAASEGTWYVWGGAASDAAVYDLIRDERVSAVAISHELGCALLDDAAADRMGFGAIAVIELPRGLKGSREQVAALMNGPRLSEGRMPETPDEVVLPVRLKGVALEAGLPVGGASPSDETGAGEGTAADWSATTDPDTGSWNISGSSGAASDGPLAVGSTITLDLGTRSFDSGALTNATDERFVGDEVTGVWEAQRLERSERRTYTVVGFRRPQDNFLGDNLVASQSCAMAVTCAGAASSLEGPPTSQSVWACADGYATEDGFEAVLDAFSKRDETPRVRFTSTDCLTHQQLIRYVGLVEGREIFDGIWALAYVLVAVIVVASVALVYTSFAIAVNERTKEFGLLASQGASARQLRRMVLTEALVLGGVGIPVGALLGIAGVAVVLEVTSDAFSYLFGSPGGLDLSVHPLVMAAVVAVSALVLLVSAWVPAVRTGHVPAIDAIRQARGVRVGRRALRETRRMARRGELPTSPDRLPSLLARVAGVPGFVAHRNLSRASSHGRVVAISLGVSFALFVTSGSIAQYMRPFDTYAATRGSQVASDLLADIDAGSTMTAGELVETVGRARAAIDRLDGMTTSYGECLGELQVRVPGEMVSDDLRAALDAEDESAFRQGMYYEEALNRTHLTGSGAYVGHASCSFVDDATWEGLAREAGIDPAARDTALIRGSYVSRLAAAEAEATRSPARVVDACTGPGEVEVYDLDERVIDALGHEGWQVVADGEGAGVLLSRSDGQDGYETTLLGLTVTPDAGTERPSGDADDGTLAVGSWTLQVAALTSRMTDHMALYGTSGEFPCLIMPMRLLEDHPVTGPWGGVIGVRANDTAQAAQDISDAIDALEGDFSVNVLNVRGEARQIRALSWTVWLFVTLFSVITMLIAVANAFNTLSNSVVLRAREFAVLQSVGMGPSAFKRMIVCECVSYAVRGLAVGVVLSTLVNVGIWLSFGLSFEGIGLMVPWAYVAAAAAGMAAVLAMSVVYVLHRSGATSVVDAMRADVA